MPDHPGDRDLDQLEAGTHGDRAHRRALFQEVNGRIDDLTGRWNVDGERMLLLCECGAPTCTERIMVPRATYDDVRSIASRFLLNVGHERPADRIVGREDGYLIAERSAG